MTCLCLATSVAVAQPSAPPPAKTYPYYVQQLLGAFPASQAGGAPEVDLFLPNVPLADGIRGPTCLIRVPAELIHGRAATRAAAARASWVLSNLPDDQWRQSLDQATHVYVQFWCVPLADYAKAGAELQKRLRPHRRNGRRAEIVHLGNGQNYAVFACLPQMRWPVLQQRLKLAGGADPIDAAMTLLQRIDAKSDLAALCYQTLALRGAESIEAVEYLIAIGSPHRSGAIRAMQTCDSADVTDWLIGLVASEDRLVFRAARRALLDRPRQQARALYVSWLAQRAGKTSVEAELEACAAVGATEAAAPLATVLRKPFRLREFLRALWLRRELTGHPISPQLQAAAEQVKQLAGPHRSEAETKRQAIQAVEAIAAANDTEAAAVIGVELAVLRTRRSGGSSVVNRAGLYILQHLPDGAGEKFVRQVAATCAAPQDVRRLQAIAIHLALVARSHANSQKSGRRRPLSVSRPRVAGPRIKTVTPGRSPYGIKRGVKAPHIKAIKIKPLAKPAVRTPY
ncbi:hypothetical protein LCGC14_0095580 [marine sediment metagenome]|uniref:Uncharacterized protein n=1 Tax=marine sediment metagenome TaxID=412755 RepID=A0A0F9VHU1_9ZZZZ